MDVFLAHADLHVQLQIRGVENIAGLVAQVKHQLFYAPHVSLAVVHAGSPTSTWRRPSHVLALAGTRCAPRAALLGSLSPIRAGILRLALIPFFFSKPHIIMHALGL